MGRPPSPPLYVLPHGIEVVGEYRARGKNRYWRVRIRPHPFFAGLKVVYGGYDVRRSRVVLASKLGRALLPTEHAHHEDEDRNNDTTDNLGILSPAEHNQHHKTGTKHATESKYRISESLKRAYAEGRHLRVPITNRNDKGRISK